jgi:hypothetical protein
MLLRNTSEKHADNVNTIADVTISFILKYIPSNQKK